MKGGFWQINAPSVGALLTLLILCADTGTGLVHLLDEVDLEKLRIGIRVEAVFNEERVGDIRDIKYFKPLA